VAVQGDLAEHLHPSQWAAGRRLDGATEDFSDRFDACLDIERHLSLSRVSAIQRALGRICAGSMRRSVNGHREIPRTAITIRQSQPRDLPTLGNRLSEGNRETPLRPPSTCAREVSRRWEAADEVLSDTARSPTDPAHTVALAPGSEPGAGTELVAGTERGAVSEAALYRPVSSQRARSPAIAPQRPILLRKAVSALASLPEQHRGRPSSILLFEVALESCLLTALQRESYIATAALVISETTGIPISFERQRGAYRRAAAAALAEVAETIALLRRPATEAGGQPSRWAPQTSSPPTR